MTTLKALHGKLYAGNPHVRFDEGEVASCTAEASLRRVHCRRQPEAMTRPQVASRSEVARGLRASVCAATPRRGSLLYKERAKMKKLIIMISAAALSFAVRADAPSAESGAYNDHVIAFIDTRPDAAAARIPDNPGGWIETRQCDEKMVFAAIGTIKPIGFSLIIR